MGFERWLRDKARHTVDGWFCSSSPDVQRVGDQDSGWVMHTNPFPLVCYCAGVGKGMSFEIELARRAGQPVLVFDPSPTGIATVERSNTNNLHFFPVGLAAETGTVEFSLPKDPGEGSYSIARDGIERVSFECWNLATIMGKNGDFSIDLLKMDIEGFEYDILDQLLRQGVFVRQICVEFHAWLKPGRTRQTIAKLHKSGYRIIHKHRGDHTFLMNDSVTKIDRVSTGP